MALNPDRSLHGHFHGSTACLIALFAAGRHADLLDVLETENLWPYKRWAVKALAAEGRSPTPSRWLGERRVRQRR